MTIERSSPSEPVVQPTLPVPSSPGPSALEERILTGFKWAALILALIFGAAFIAVLFSVAASRMSGPVPGSDSGLRTLEAYLADERAGREPAGSGGLADLPGPISPTASEDRRKEVYQALYNRLLETGRRSELIGDEKVLVGVVNGAITELDAASHPVDGTYAYLYLRSLNRLADGLVDRKEDGPGTDGMTLERLAEAAAGDVRRQRDRGPLPIMAPPAPMTIGTQLRLAGWLAAGFLLSSMCWGILAFIAQGRTYWLVQDTVMKD